MGAGHDGSVWNSPVRTLAVNLKRVEFLKSVDIREAWSKEDRDFTPWVAQPDVLQELLDKCDIDLGTDYEIKTEVVVPGIKRKLDILITSETGEKIAIENQFSTIDHDHLTRALMYAVGLQAKTVIIIAESHRAEFVALADYLNGAAKAYEDEGISLFLVEIEVLSSAESNVYHPRFDVVSRPDEWRAALFQATHHVGERSERSASIFNFHEQLLPLIRERTGIFRNVVASDGSWKAGSFGISSVQVKYDVAKDNVAVQLWFHRKVSSENRAGLACLRTYQSEIERLFEGHHVEWRVQNTSVIEVRISEIGWGTNHGIDKTNELIGAISKMVSIAMKYKDEIRQAMTDSNKE